MNIIRSIRWAATWLSMGILKRSLHYRLTGQGASWLQAVRSNEPAIFNRVDFILDQCRDKKVLHVGFTDHPYTVDRIHDGSLLHLRLKEVAAQLFGMDIEEEAINQYVAAKGDKDVVAGDITKKYPDGTINFKPEIILLSEVLEHLTEPYKAIDVLHQSFTAATSVLVTVPNYTALDSIVATLHNTESVHPHHHWYFSPYTLRQLFDEKRFKLQQLHFGMYYQPNTKINRFLKGHPFTGDCIIAFFTIIKNEEHA